MSNADKHRRLGKLEASIPKPVDENYYKEQIAYRLLGAITGELGNVSAPTFVPGVVNGGPSLAAQEFGEDYTVGQWYEFAIRRAVDRLEEVARKPYGNSMGDLTPYLEPEDLTPEGRERLVQVFVAHFKEDRGENWDDANRHYRRKVEAEEEENRRAKEQEWKL
jgi:hypothetical protein